jgi:hypothetical protein
MEGGFCGKQILAKLVAGMYVPIIMAFGKCSNKVVL